MTTSDKPSPKEVLAEIKTTRGVLEDLPSRLDKVEKRGDKLLRAVIAIASFVFGVAILFLWNDSRNNSEQNDRFDEFAYCQAEYNRVNSIVSKTRADLNSKLNAAQAKRDKKIGVIVSGGKGDIQAVFADYSSALARLETARADNPLPAYPDCYTKYIKGK